MRILLVDDHEIVRRGLRMVLELEKGFEIVGEASTGSQAITLAQEQHPDLILMDLKMGEMDGAQATRRIKATKPSIRVLILTGVESFQEITAAIDAGADGYVLKTIAPDELVRAVHVIASGEPYLQPSVTKYLLQKMRAPVRAQSEMLATLTARECEILRLMASSATYKEIAGKLVISEETVRTHSKNVLAKLGQPNRTQAVMYAIRQGLVTLD